MEMEWVLVGLGVLILFGGDGLIYAAIRRRQQIKRSNSGSTVQGRAERGNWKPLMVLGVAAQPLGGLLVAYALWKLFGQITS